MAGVNIENSGLTFIKYQQGITETLNQEARTFKDIRQETWRGQQIEKRLHVARSTAMSFTEDGGAFSSPDKQDYTPAKYSRRFYEASIQLTDGVMATAAQSPQVAKDVLDSEVEGMMEGALKFYNQMFFRDGTGVCATIKGGTLSGSSNILVDDARLLWEGATFDMYDSTYATNRGTVTVSAVDSALDASTGYASVDFTAALPSGASTTDVLVWSGSLNKAIAGLDSLVDDASGTFQNVSTTTYPRYTSMVLSNSGTNRDMTPTLFRQLLAGIRQKSGNDKPSSGLMCVSDSWLQMEFSELYEGEIRITPDTKSVGSGAVSFVSPLGAVTLESDTDCIRHKLFAVAKGELTHYVQRPLGWRMQNGQIFLRSDRAGYHTATMLCISQVAIEKRHTSGKIEDLTDNALIAY